MKSPLLLATLVVACFCSNGQSVNVTDLDVTDQGTISFRYSVTPKYSDREYYKLEVYTSANNYASPLLLALEPVQAGQLKRVEFDGPAVIGDFKGQLQFKFKTEASLFPVRITTTAKKFKSGKNITIAWDDFHESGWYNVELYKDGLISKTLVKNFQRTIYTGDLPKKMEKGIYEVRVTPANEEQLFSDDYSVDIKSSGGAGVFVLGGAALLGGGAYAAGLFGGEDPGGNSSTNLPDPPIPGDGN